MSFQLEPIDQAKLDALKNIGWGNILFAELVVVHWPAPTGAIVYSMTEYDRMPEYAGLLENEDFQALTSNPIQARFGDKVFQKVQHGSSIDDSITTFDFIDDDQEIARLSELHGEGVRVSILFYFPQVDWLRERWWGHLGMPDEVGGIMTPVHAAFGFRSSQSSLPSRTRGAGCPHNFGGTLQNAEEIAENPCRYDRHIEGMHGLLDADDQPFRSCGHTQADCQARIGDLLEYGGGETAADTVIVSETKGPSLQSTVKGNETNLKKSRRVVFGDMRLNQMECLASRVEPDTKHPDKGSAEVLIDGCEGSISAMDDCHINGLFVGAMHLNVRLGTYRQPRTGFSVNANNYSMTAHFYGVIQGDFRGYQPGSFTGSAHIIGLNDTRVYSDANTFTKQHSRSPAWCILRMLADKVWGDGQDYSRFVIQDWIDAAVWCALLAGFMDASGNHYTGVRAIFNAILEERTTQQQIGDACLYAGLSLPFPFQGKNRILPLKKEDLTNVPVFSDDPDLLALDPTVRQIMFNGEGSTLRTKKVRSEGELTNYLVLTFLDAAHNNIERPLTIQDDAMQRAAGRAFGDSSRRIVKEEVSAFGVTDFGQAVRAMNRYLDLGPHDQGGKENNREVSFVADFLDTLDLHKYKVIKVVSKTLEKYKQPSSTEKSFQYFRIQEMADQEELLMHLRCVAYPEDYYERMEDETQPPLVPGDTINPNPGGTGGDGGRDRPGPVYIPEISHTNDQFRFRLALTGS